LLNFAAAAAKLENLIRQTVALRRELNKERVETPEMFEKIQTRFHLADNQ